MNCITKLFYYCLPVLLVCFAYSSNSYAKGIAAKPEITMPLDSSKVDVRKLNTEEQKKMLENKEYKYDRIGPAPKSLWDRFWDWIWNTIDKIFDTKGGNLAWTLFQSALVMAAIVVIIILVIKNDIRAIFYGRSASVQIDFKEFNEDINAINFDELIADAVSKKDYRKAIRLHFLKLLKELSDNNLIKWQIDKTNNDYSIELSSSKYNSKFNELSIMYEYIWYGDFPLDETNFRGTISKFKEFKV